MTRARRSGRRSPSRASTARSGGPLWDWIDERREPWLRVGEYELLAPIGQDARPVLVARVDAHPGTLELSFARQRSDPVARIERITIVDTRDGRLVGDSAPGDAARALVELGGTGATDAQGHALRAFDLSEDRVIRVRAPAAIAGLDTGELVVRALDARGRVVARLVFAR